MQYCVTKTHLLAAEVESKQSILGLVSILGLSAAGSGMQILLSCTHASIGAVKLVAPTVAVLDA